MQQLIDNLSKQPTLCITISILIFLFGFLLNYLLLDALLQMHRSKNAVKKLKKEYTFLQRLSLLHFKENCCHAVKFCNGLIVFQKVAWGCLVIYLFISLLFSFGIFSATIVAWFAVGFFVLFDMPAFVLQLLLSRPIVFSRFKEYSFEKYHNTENHNSLL